MPTSYYLTNMKVGNNLVFRLRVLKIFRHVKVHMGSLWIFPVDCLKVFKKILIVGHIHMPDMHLSPALNQWMEQASYGAGWSHIPGGLRSPEQQCSNGVLTRCNITLHFHLRYKISSSLSKLQLSDLMCAISWDPMEGHIAFAPSKKRKKDKKIHLLTLFEGFQWSVQSSEPQRSSQ